MIESAITTKGMEGAAQYSDCGLYRFTLVRKWGDGPHLVAVMLNPSKATAGKDDPTTTVMLGFARRLGFGRYTAINLFAYRATKPADMMACLDPICIPTNDRIIAKVLASADAVLVAWGTGGRFLSRDLKVIDMLADYDALCFGHTKDGDPKFPRALRKDAPLVAFVSREAPL